MTLPIFSHMLPKVGATSSSNVIASGINYKTYQILTGETTITVAIGKVFDPVVATLTSSDGTRKIEYSTDNGVTYYLATYTQNPAGQLVTHIDFAITHIKVTGIAGDTLTILK